MSYCLMKLDELNLKYHNEEWGIPVHDDRKQFEYLMLEVMQCGLSWTLVLKKREIFRKCFDNFDFNKISQYNEEDIDRIYNTEGMIRSKRKINAIINNARVFIKIREQYNSFDNFLWNYSNNRTILYDGHDEGKIPVSNGLSSKISLELRKKGMKFLGPITIYSHLQACGIINDHSKECFCYKKIISNYPTVRKRGYLEKF